MPTLKKRQDKEKLPAAAAASPKRGITVLAGTLVVLLLAYTAALFALRPPSPGDELSLDRLQRLAIQGHVATARFLDEDARITGALKNGTEYWTSYPRSDTATNDLLKTFFNAGTRASVDPQTSKAMVRFVAQFLLPLVILANLFALLFVATKGREGGASDFLLFGRIGNKKVGATEKSRTTFADVAAPAEMIVELAEVRDYLADPRAFEAMGAMPPKGVLLVGPPGCGKTLLARAVAGEANANFYSISGSEFVESLVGVGAARVRDLFAQARASAPAIIFIDELDGAGRQRGAGMGGGHDEREQTLNELLVQMDGFSPSDGVVVMGATNRPDILDPALLRAGRFDRRITVERPDAEVRLDILRLHAGSRRLVDPHSDLPHIAKRTAGFTGADLAAVVNEAALLAVRSKSEGINRRHLEEAVERVLSGPRRAARIISPGEKRRIATHEAGHAVVAAAMGKGAGIDKLSVVARANGVGHLAVLEEDKVIFTRDDMEAQITIAMAGVAAEELVFGQPSTGAEGDLERATNTARDMAGRFGMSRLGRVRVLREHGEIFLGRDYLSTQDVSQPTLEHLDAEVSRILSEEEAAAQAILSQHRELLDRLTNELLNRETLQGAELDQLFGGVAPYARPARKRPSNGSASRATKAGGTTKTAKRSPRPQTEGDDL
ncbi:MAG: ATP-dependent zinc metalloprotease FtsH [Actinobacteria bacterium]|nr:ATP-dependent zinc metalloprotease FtsH [Actinomycetota bacterium]